MSMASAAPIAQLLWSFEQKYEHFGLKAAKGGHLFTIIVSKHYANPKILEYYSFRVDFSFLVQKYDYDK